jgi:hypothetical protein
VVVFVILILVLSLKEAGMQIRHLILALLMLGLLVACSSPNASPGNNSGTWDQSNFESANWN